jgi:hypothetical protein
MKSPYRALRGEYLHLNFRVHRDHHIELLPSFHLPGLIPAPTATPVAGVTIELRGRGGEVLSFHRCHQDPLVDPDSPVHTFHEVLPWHRETAALAVLVEAEETQILDVEECAPEITTPPAIALDHNKITCQWDAEQTGGRDEPITYLVRYSNDDGETWRALDADLSEPRLVTDLDTLPGGERCIFQVAASAGIRTTIVETEPLAVDIKPRRPYIVSPQPNASFREGDSVVLGGVGLSPDFGTATVEETVWTSNIDGFIGYGYEVITNGLARGIHMVRFAVADGLGGEASAEVRIKIEERGSDRLLRRPTEGAGEVRLIR